MQITITVRGNKEFIRKMQRSGKNMDNHRTAFKKIGKALKSYYANEAFASEGGVFGAPWPPLKSRTVRSRTAQVGGSLAAGVGAAQMLVRSGRMKRSFFYKAEKDSVVITNSADYFKYHQSEKPRRKIPRRQMIGINNKVKRLVRQELRDSVRRKIATA